MLELVGAYATFANGGYALVPHVVQKITAANGKVLYARNTGQLGRIVEARHVAMMNQMMAETLTIGTAHKAALPGWPAAGKTGTSQDFRDAWFIGYTAHLVTGVWLGNDDGTSTKAAPGAACPSRSGAASCAVPIRACRSRASLGRPAAASSRDCSATVRGRYRRRRCNRLLPRGRPRLERAASMAGCLTASSAAVNALGRGHEARASPARALALQTPSWRRRARAARHFVRGTIRPPPHTPPPRFAAKSEQ